MFLIALELFRFIDGHFVLTGWGLAIILVAGAAFSSTNYFSSKD